MMEVNTQLNTEMAQKKKKKKKKQCFLAAAILLFIEI